MATRLQAVTHGRRDLRILPPEASGYAFDPIYSWWSTIVAEESTNLIINPSFERKNDAGFVDEYETANTWTEIDDEFVIVDHPDVGVIAGRRCAMLVSPTGIGHFTYIEGVVVTPGEYTFSLDIYVVYPPMTMTLWVLTTGDVRVASTSIVIRYPGWQRIHLSYVETETTTRRLRLSGNNADSHTGLVYTDAWQFERKPYPTTYLDGDMMGFSDILPYSSYFWQGTPHGSPSLRRASTGSGGKLISWSDLARFMTTSIIGLDMAPVEQRSHILGNGKQVHLGVNILARDFTITGTVFGQGHADLKRRLSELVRLHRPNNTARRDQMIVRFQEVDDAEQLVGKPMDIVCVYQDGLQGSMSSLYQQQVAIQFTAVQPHLRDIFDSSAALTLVQELVANQLVYRDEYGEYQNLGTGTTLGGVVARAGFMRNGSIVAFGNFTQLAGVVVSSGAYWNGATWVSLGVPTSGVTDIDDGFKLGFPLTVGATNGSVYEYDEVADTWDELGDGFTGSINAITRDENGDIWVAGQFEFAQDGITTFNNVAKWDASGAVWEQIGQGVTDVGAVFPDPLEATTVLAPNDGYIYFGGTFDRATASPVTTMANAVVRWNIAEAVYEGMGTGFNAAPTQLILGEDGYIYAVGPFDQDGAANFDLRGFARWNGYSWEEVFPLTKPGGVYGADGVVQDEQGIFWFYNSVDDVNTDLFIVEGLGEVPFFGYRNGVFYPPYMVDADIRQMALGPGDRAIHVTGAYVGAGTPTKAPAMTRVTYEGTADAAMIIHIQGPGLLNQIRHNSTEGGIFARSGFNLSAHEQVIMRNDTLRTLIYSNQRRNLYNRLLGGASNMAAMRLIPGENRISLLVTGADEITSAAWLTWRNAYWGIGENS